MHTILAVAAASMLLSAGTGCPAPKSPLLREWPSHDKQCDLNAMVAPAFCPPADCGTNSSVINVFPYNGLHPDGCVNEGGVGLAPMSLAREYSQCDKGHTDRLYLDFAEVAQVEPSRGATGYELVAKDQEGAIRCKGPELVGATFVLVNEKASSQVTLRISQMGTTSVAAVPSVVSKPMPDTLAAFTKPATTQSTVVPPAKRTVYLITPADQPMNSLCTSLPPEAAPGKPTPILINQPTASGQLSDVDVGELASYALIIPGAIYDAKAQLITRSVAPATSQLRGSSHRWFNLACADDALAQTELSGLATTPITDLASASARLPALHMFTAKYCDGISATTRGMPISWRLNGPSLPRGLNRDGRGPLEATWGPGGALCVEHSRLWMSNKTISLPFQLLGLAAFQDPDHPITFPVDEGDFLSRLCPGRIKKCEDLDAPNTLVSYTVNHVDE